MGMGDNVIGVAYGENFPDALALGPLAAKNGAPLILVREFVPKSIEDLLIQNKGSINYIFIAGGNDVVSEDVKDNISKIIGL